MTDVPATEQQKDFIAVLAALGGEPIDRHGRWPSAFTAREANRWIEDLQAALEARRAAFPSFFTEAGRRDLRDSLRTALDARRTREPLVVGLAIAQDDGAGNLVNGEQAPDGPRLVSPVDLHPGRR